MDSVNILLVLMVKNESRILQRCLASTKDFVDAVLISDTGSTDDTLEIARAYDAKPREVVQETWSNFGVNRTLSLHSARAFAVRLGWRLDHTYALVLDADMTIHGYRDELRKLLGERPTGLQLLQRNDAIQYANTRLMLLSDPWVCEGVTHEYWTGGHGDVGFVSSDAVWIDDVGDGGAKADKFQRDERLLVAGLEEKPNCERYMFYLAQTYHCLKRHDDHQMVSETHRSRWMGRGGLVLPLHDRMQPSTTREANRSRTRRPTIIPHRERQNRGPPSPGEVL